MKKNTFVCYECRKAKKDFPIAVTDERIIECPWCHGPMVQLSYVWRIPKKTNIKAWKKLQKRFPTHQHSRITYGQEVIDGCEYGKETWREKWIKSNLFKDKK